MTVVVPRHVKRVKRGKKENKENKENKEKAGTVTKKETSSKAKGGYAMEYPVDKALSDFVGSDKCSRITVIIRNRIDI